MAIAAPMPPQCPLPRQAPPVVAPKVVPVVEACCSSACTCGCNEGQPCRCGNSSTQRVSHIEGGACPSNPLSVSTQSITVPMSFGMSRLSTFIPTSCFTSPCTSNSIPSSVLNLAYLDTRFRPSNGAPTTPISQTSAFPHTYAKYISDPGMVSFPQRNMVYPLPTAGIEQRATYSLSASGMYCSGQSAGRGSSC